MSSDLLDFGGKYRYLYSLYESNINHTLVQQIAIYSITIITGLITTGLAILLISPFGRETKHRPKGCRRYGLQSKSHLSGGSSGSKSSSSTKTKSKGPIKVQSIWLYPIKSCRGIEVEQAEITETGIRYDRQYCFAQLHSPFPLSISDSKANASAHQWRFITQREFALLSQVRTELWLPDPKAIDYDANAPYVQTGGAIVVRFPYEEDGIRGYLANLISRLRGSKTSKSFLIPISPTDEQTKTQSFTLEPLKIWKDTPLSLNMGSILPPELKYFLGVRNPLALFRVSTPRQIFRNAPRFPAELSWQPITGFADAYPLNLAGLSSIAALDAMQPPGSAQLGFLRFRGNLAITGTDAFDEEQWKKIRIGDREYFICCRCVRCGVPNVDPETGIKHRAEPSRTLITQRNVDKGSPKYGCLGMQMVPVQPEGWIKVGDEIHVSETGEHFYEEM